MTKHPTRNEITAYKAFDPDFTCRGFKFEVGATYEHSGPVELCSAGFHAVTVPFDAWNYYPGSRTLARVKLASASPQRDGDSKIVGARITIEARLSLSAWISAQVETVIALCKSSAAPVATAPDSHAAATGYAGHAAATGYAGHAAATGDAGHAAATGTRGHAAATGDAGHAAATGYAGHAAATGDAGHAAATGTRGHAAATGKYAIAVSVGHDATAQAGPDGWITLATWGDYNGSERPLLLVKSAKVGTEGVAPGKTYKLSADGLFIEVER